MKILLLILLALALYAIYVSYPIYRSLAATKKTEAVTVSYEQHPADPTMRILVTGDSTAVGTGAADSKYSTAGRLGQKYPTADIQNISENGLKMAGLLKKLSGLGDAHYDLIVLQIGANDVVQLTPFSSIEKDMKKLLDIAQTHADRVVVITSGNMGLTPVFKFPLSTYVTSRTVKLRSMYMNEIAQRQQIRFADLFQDKKDDIFSTDPKRYYAADFFHPSSDGYQVWIDAINKALASFNK